ncbi:MAG: VanZ family protein [Dysosmobacter sp.]
MRYVWITADYLRKMLPGVLAALAVYGCLYPRRCRRLQAAGLISLRRREIALVLFWMFCGGMVMLTLTPREFDLIAALRWGWAGPFFRLGSVNLIPFQTVRLNGMLLYILLGNILMFLPFGFFPALVWRGSAWKRALLTGFCVTGFIECWQLLVGRAFDIDDLWLNTLGAMAGFWLLRLLERLAPAQVEKFRVRPI